MRIHTTRFNSASYVLIPLMVALALVTVCAWKLLHTRVLPSEDQLALVTYTFDAGYPTLEDGVSSFLISGAYHTIGSTDLSVADAHLRTFAMAVFFVAGTLLFWKLTSGNSLIAFFLALGLLCTSRISMLWLSSEVLAAAYVMLTLWSIVSHRPFALTSLFIVAFALAKPDLLSSGLIVGLFVAWSQNEEAARARRVAILLGMLALFLLPGFLYYGIAYIAPRGRALLSFSQHYAALVREHQLTPSRPNPWNQQYLYVNAVWGPVKSMSELIRTNPYRYMDFVFLSLAKSIRNLVPSNVMWLLPVAAFSLYFTDNKQYRNITLLYLTGLIPILLLSFLHIRYQARFYVLALAVIGLGVPYIAQHKQKVWIAGYLVVVLLWQSYQFLHVFPAGYWLPD